GDLFLQSPLLRSAKKQLQEIALFTKGRQMLVLVGLPWEHGGKLYNVAAALCGGRLLGLVPKTHLPNYSEFYEQRHFR
ncbi:NAD(+) synthase, partial [Klebsiella oxytoca]